MKKLRTKQHEILVDNKTYTLNITYKRMKSVIFRFDHENDAYKVSAPLLTTTQTLENFFIKHHDKLLKMQTKVAPPFGEYTFVFGHKVLVEDVLSAYNIKIKPLDLKSFYKVMNKHLLNYIKPRVRYYEQIMNIPLTYKMRVRDMKTRWGTNSLKTNTLTFASALIHFDHKTIDALIVHELAHYYHHGHNKRFYDYLEEIYPNYKSFDKKLKERNYV